MYKACVMCGRTSDEIGGEGIVCFECGRWICKECWKGYAERCLCGWELEERCGNCSLVEVRGGGLYVCKKEQREGRVMVEVHPLNKGCELWVNNINGINRGRKI